MIPLTILRKANRKQIVDCQMFHLAGSAFTDKKEKGKGTFKDERTVMYGIWWGTHDFVDLIQCIEPYMTKSEL